LKSFIVISIISLFVSSAHAKYSGGTGEPDDPYKIATAEDLMLLGETYRDYDKHFVLTADIDMDPNLPGRKVFDDAVIGYHYFRGVFNGNGHNILNLTIKGRSSGHLGFFSSIASGAEIRDLGIVDVNIVGENYVIGGLVGTNGGDLINCYVSGTIRGAGSNIGGMVGLNYHNIIQSYSTCTVKGKTFVGGLVGENLGHITECYSTSVVSGRSKIGGLAGSNGTTLAIRGGPGFISDCYSTGQVSATEGVVGGIVGYNASGNLIRCYSTGSVVGNEDIGGLVGLNKDTVIQCFWDIQTSHQTTSVGGSGKTSTEMKKINTFLLWGTCGNDGIWKIDEGRDYPRLYWEDKPGELIVAGSTLSEFLTGEGTEDNPFLIYSAKELNLVGSFPCDWDKYFKLMSDIDLSDFDGREDHPTFNIIGSGKKSRSGVPFTGIFDGNGYTIANFTYTPDEDVGNIGLFGFIADANAQIKNVGLIDPNIDGGTQWNIGCLAGFLKDGSIINCYVERGSVKGGQNVGGLIGYNDRGSISKCYSTSMDIEADGQVGGLVGENWLGSITMSYSSGSITAKFGCVGGLVGMNDYSSIDTCYSTCTVSIVSSKGSDAGGLVGFNGRGRITTCYSTGIVTGDYVVGGFTGSNSGSIIVSYSTGPVTGNRGVGGLVGTNTGNLVSNYSTGTVIGNDAVGGLVGGNGGSISMSYSSGTVSGISYVGGLVGSGDPGFATNSVWDKEASGQTISAGGMGLTTIEMQDIDIFLNMGWDFVGEILNGTCDYWQISPGDYPRLCCYNGNSPKMPQGFGTAQEPYMISDSRDLGTVWFKPLAHYQLETSIDMSGIMWSTAAIPWFGGTFDGNGHVISNLHIKGSGHLGLFGQLEFGATISNVGIEKIDIHGTGNNIGGLVGTNGGAVTMSYSIGTVIGNEDVGGLVGRNIRNLTSSYSNVNVTGNKRVGGLLGVCFSYSGIKNNYSTGVVIGNEDVGGLIGYNYWSDITSCFWDIETSGLTTSIDGIGLTTADMQTASTFLEAGWDFVEETENGTDDIWWILEGQDYPRLWWETDSN
jgi:hypothetical protein